MARVGITGASGFLGSYLLSWLARNTEHELRALARTIPPTGWPGPPGVTWLQGDLASSRDCTAFAAELDTVVHLAGANTPLTSNADLPADAGANLVPTLTLLQALRELGTRPHVVFASSGGAVYGRSADRLPFGETRPCEPSSSYGIQKLAVEHYLRVAAEGGWLTATALRIGNPYGVLLPPERLQGFIGVALNQLVHGLPIRIFDDPANVRDYVHLDDMCRMFELVLAPREAFAIYNVGSGEGYSVDDVVELLEGFVGDVRVERQSMRPELQPLPSWVVLDVTKALAELGWAPSVPLEAGLERLSGEVLARR